MSASLKNDFAGKYCMSKPGVKSLPSLSVRIDLDSEGRIGPGKIQLLENIHKNGSISAAGRAMDMSYKRAWDLVDEINRICRQAAVERQTGGKNGGGAVLTAFGLGSGVWTQDVSKAHKVAKALRAGSVWVNCYQAMDPAVPFGGYKMSGYGRESGKQHLEEYLNVKAVWIKTG